MTRVWNAHTSAWMYLTTTLMRRMITTPGILLLNLSTVKWKWRQFRIDQTLSMNSRMLHQSHTNRHINTNIQQKLKCVTCMSIIWTMSAQNYCGDYFIHTTQQTSSFRMSNSGIEIHDHKWRSGIVQIFRVPKLRNSTWKLVKMSHWISGFEILELRNTKYKILCKRWKIQEK